MIGGLPEGELQNEKCKLQRIELGFGQRSISIFPSPGGRGIKGEGDLNHEFHETSRNPEPFGMAGRFPEEKPKALSRRVGGRHLVI